MIAVLEIIWYVKGIRREQTGRAPYFSPSEGNDEGERRE
jgi:hypothetical protein